MFNLRNRFRSCCLAFGAILLLGCGGEPAATLDTGADFTIAVSSGQLRVAPGTTAVVDLTFTWAGCCPPLDLNLELLGAPAGVTPEFSANPAAVNSQLRLRVASGTASGSHTLVVRASRQNLVHTRAILLNVDAAAPSFSISVQPGAVALDAAHPATATLAVQRTGGFSGAVEFSVQVPAGFTAIFDPPAHASAAAESRVLRMTCGSTPAGAYTVQVRATSAGLLVVQDLPATVVGLPSISQFTAAPATIEFGASTQLLVGYAGGTGVVAGVGPVPSGAAATVTPAVTSSYVLTVSNSLGSTVQAAATVAVEPVVVTVNPPASTLYAGESVALTATVTGAVNKAVTWSGNVVANGTSAVFTAPSQPGPHAIVATSVARPASTGTAVVTVHPDPAAQLVAAKPIVTAGQGTTLTPTFVGGTAVLTPSLGPLASGVPLPTGPLTRDTTYQLEVTAPSGQKAIAVATIRVVPAPSAQLLAGSSLIPAGSSAQLLPTFAHGTAEILPLNLTGFSSGTWVDTGPIFDSTTFILRVTSPAGEVASASTTVSVYAPPVITSFELTAPDTVVGVFTGSASGLADLYDNTNPLAPVLLDRVVSGQALTRMGPVPEAWKLVVTNLVGQSAVAFASNILVTINEGDALSLPGRTAHANPSQAFTATVTGSTAGVQWSVSGGTDPGAIGTHSGVYAPSSAAGTFTVTAASKADPGKTDSIAVRVVPVWIWPAGQVVGLNHKLLLRAVVAGAPAAAVTWSMDPSTPAGATYGTVDTNGVYTSPPTVPPTSPIIVATPAAFPTLSARAVVVVSTAVNGGGRIRTITGGPPSLVSSFAFTADPRKAHTLTTLANGEVLLAGGEHPFIPGSRPTTAYYYRTADQTFYANAAPMQAGRSWATATLLYDGSVLITGGEDAAGNPLAQAERFIPFSAHGGTFQSTAGAMARARAHHTATLLPDGRVLLVGGRSSLAPSVFEATAEVYDPATDSFTLLASGLRSPRIHHRAVRLLDGRVLVAGGTTDGLPNVVTMSAQADLFDPATNTFTPAANMGWKTIHPAMDVVPDGRVLVAGGFVADTGAFPSGFFQSYEPAANAWIPPAPGPNPYVSMSFTRDWPLGMMLPDQTFAIWGGNIGATNVDFWTPFAPALDTPSIPLPPPLANFTPFEEGNHGRMVLMLNGRILAAGWDGSNLFTFRAVTIP